MASEPIEIVAVTDQPESHDGYEARVWFASRTEVEAWVAEIARLRAALETAQQERRRMYQHGRWEERRMTIAYLWVHHAPSYATTLSKLEHADWWEGETIDERRAILAEMGIAFGEHSKGADDVV